MQTRSGAGLWCSWDGLLCSGAGLWLFATGLSHRGAGTCCQAGLRRTCLWARTTAALNCGFPESRYTSALPQSSIQRNAILHFARIGPIAAGRFFCSIHRLLR